MTISPEDLGDLTLDADGNLISGEDTTTSAEPPEVPPLDDFDARLEVAIDTALITSEVEERYSNIDCSTVGSDTSGRVADDNAPLVTCSDNQGTPENPMYSKYILGPVMVEGNELSSASSGLQTNQQGQSTGEWAVNLTLKPTGTTQFGKVTAKIVDLETPLNQFAIVLDDRVITAPRVNSSIPDGRAEISGNFTQSSSKTLADQLSFGSLPLNFSIQSREQVSATLGTEALQRGLLAGFIGLILVAIYSLLQYRALAFVTILSLIIATGITYGSLLVLSWTQGYRLSLAGVAGIIVSIGVTADSFIVYFERIKDELRDGRPLQQAVNVAWLRARRTILASDGVNFLAAIVLYFLSVGGVRGFAFTLGLTTVMDLVVVFMFTHPVILLISRIPFWLDGHPMSGLDPHRLGAPGSVHYAGRGRVSRVKGGPAPTPAAIEERPSGRVRREIAASAPVAGDQGLSIAERKAQAALRTGQTEGEES
jgi:preprotein translocase subunit SecD